MTKTWYAITNQTPDSADVEIYDEIGGWGISAKEFIKGLKDLEGKHLNLRINSPGGSIIDGQAIIAALGRHKAGFTAWVDGLAASMASVIACAADRCFMAEGAMMMIHRASTVSMGDAEDLRKDASLLEKFEKGLINIYANKTGMAPEEIQTMLSEETWMDALEAVALGFCDGITDNSPAMAMVSEKDHKARFDNFKKGMAKPTNSEETAPEVVVAPEVVPASEPVPAVEAAPETIVEKVEEVVHEVIKKVEEVVGEVVEKIEGKPSEEVPSEPAAKINADSFVAKFNEIQARAEAAENRATLAEAKLASVMDQLSKLEASLGIASAKKDAKVCAPEIAATKSLSLEEWRALAPAERSAFMRSGGRLTD
jgi:ATP-dependent protease ClpP protease subunit